MLRMAFVAAIVALGLRFALRDALGALLLYLWFGYFRPDYWVWDSVTLQSLNLSLIIGVYLLIRALLSGVSLRLDLRTALLFTMLMVSLASTLMSARQDYSWPWWEDFAKALIVVYIMASVIEEPDQFRMVILVIALSLGFEAAKQGWMGLITSPGGRNDNRWAMLGDNNGVAVGMWMLTALFSALAATAKTTWEKRVHQFFLVGIVYRALVTYSRGGFLTAVTFCLLYLARAKHKLRSAFAIAAVALVILPLLPSEFWARMSTIPTSETDLSAATSGDDENQPEDASMAGRLHFWRVAVEMGLNNPLFGVGLNAFSRFYDDYDSEDHQFGRRRAVHSMWFGTFAELGVTGFVVFLSILGASLLDCSQIARRAKKGELPPEMYHYAIAVQSGFVACMVGGTFLSFQYNEMLWHFVGLTMALRGIAMKVTVQSTIAASAPVPEPTLLDPHAPRIPPRRRPAGAPAGA